MQSFDMVRFARRHAWTPGLLVLVSIAACGGGGEQQASVAESAATPAAAPEAAAAAQGSGEQLYQRCVTCHQANGEGLPGAFPPLAGSEYAIATNPAVPIRVVLQGMQGPVTVKGATFNSIMPPYGTGIEMTDEEVAAVLTYVRQAWGNNASPITPEQVAGERAAAKAAGGPVTAEALKPLM